MDLIALTIDGKQVSCPPGTSILKAAEQLGIAVPTLCHHPALEPVGACRLCLVEDEKSGRLFASCVTPIAPNMAISTTNERIRKHRRTIIRLMLAEHSESCLVCSKGNRCRLREIAARLGVGATDLYPVGRFKPLEQTNPFIIRDLNKCIVCGTCIRADHELVGVGAIDYNFRGFKARPATVHNHPLEESSCTFCGTCVSLCPTGALSVQHSRYLGTPEREDVTVCGFCGTGCWLRLGVANNTVIEANPADRTDSINGPTLCVRGHFAHDFLNSGERLTAPLIRDDGGLRVTTWEHALGSLTRRLLAIKEAYGPQSIGFLGSSKCTNEENYLMQKVARSLLNTNSIDNGGYLSGQRSLRTINDRLGGTWSVPAADFDKAEVIVMIGADPTHSAPVLSYAIKRAMLKGTPLISIDPRKTELARLATLWLPVRPGADLTLISGLVFFLCQLDGGTFSFIDHGTKGLADFQKRLSLFDSEIVTLISGVSTEALRQAADMLYGRRVIFIVGHGILLQPRASMVLDALVDLVQITGTFGAPGTGFCFSARENNETGAWDMGSVPDALPGRVPIDHAEARKAWEHAWQCRISPDPGLNYIRMIQEAEQGVLKALYIMGENPVRSLPEEQRVRAALSRLDLLVVQDILSTETAQLAHVILPGAAFSEKEGSFTSLEGRIQTFRAVVPPPGEARADWKILDDVSMRLGALKRFGSVAKIRSEIVQLVPQYAEMSSGRDIGWITKQTPVSPGDRQGEGVRMRFSDACFTTMEVTRRGDETTAVMGSLRFHLGSGTRTSCSDRIRDFEHDGTVMISPEDAADRRVKDGQRLRIRSVSGSIERQVKVQRGLRQGVIVVARAVNGNDACKLLALAPLEKDAAPSWNACRVSLEKI